MDYKSTSRVLTSTPNVHVIGVTKKEGWVENIFEEVMVEIFPHLMRTIKPTDARNSANPKHKNHEENIKRNHT